MFGRKASTQVGIFDFDTVGFQRNNQRVNNISSRRMRRAAYGTTGAKSHLCHPERIYLVASCSKRL